MSRNFSLCFIFLSKKKTLFPSELYRTLKFNMKRNTLHVINKLAKKTFTMQWQNGKIASVKSIKLKNVINWFCFPQMIISCHDAWAKISKPSFARTVLIVFFFLGIQINQPNQLIAWTPLWAAFLLLASLKLWHLWLIERDAATLLLDTNPSERVKVPINKRGNGV